MMAGKMVPGFADPPLEAQSVFRSILDAMAHPGRICTIAQSNASAPGLLDPAAFAFALTLVDFETPVWLDQGFAADQEVVEALRFHCGCPIIEDPAHASFAFVNDVRCAPPLSAFHQGTPDYPDRSTTVVMQVSGLDDTEGAQLTGPGIKKAARLAVDGASWSFWQQWSINHGRYPLGVDLILTSGSRLAALPRSVHGET